MGEVNHGFHVKINHIIKGAEVASIGEIIMPCAHWAVQPGTDECYEFQLQEDLLSVVKKGYEMHHATTSHS